MILKTGAAVLTLMLATPALAEDCNDLASLITFVKEETGYRITPPCPKVFHISPTEFPVPGREAEQMENGPKLAALYRRQTGDIYVDRDIPLNAAFGRSLLVHELVHAFQFENAAHDTARCANELEAVAYAVQARFLADVGEPRQAALTQVLGHMMSGCGDEYG
ncbi:hypothetical protein [Halovulum sp. GXIMD14793]